MFRAFAFLLLAIASQRSFVDTAPTAPQEQGSPEIVPETLDSNVKELESLKQSIGKTLEMMKTHSSVYTDVNGHKETHSDSRSEVKENGNLVAKVNQHVDAESPGVEGQNGSGSVRTEIDVPSKGIHKSLVEQLVPDYSQYTDNGNRRSQLPIGYEGSQPRQDTNTLDRYGAYSGTQYSPLDMAEYVFWTGDEKGVTLAIEEFLQEGLMSREEAISFLQEIKYNLDYLQTHYTQLGLNARERSKLENTETQQKQAIAKEQQHLEQQQQKQQHQQARPELKTNFDISKLRLPTAKKNEGHGHRKEQDLSPRKLEPIQQQQEEEYDELLERLRVADFLYTEYSLEEVIYQLAKVMFTQSLTRGSAEAQQALQKFTTFLETEADQGHISRSLEKKVLDVLIASLTDTLNEHPELASSSSEVHPQSIGEGQNILRQILQLSPEDKAGMRAVLNPYKEQNRNDLVPSPVDIQMKEKPHAPLGLGKYKTIR